MQSAKRQTEAKPKIAQNDQNNWPKERWTKRGILFYECLFFEFEFCQVFYIIHLVKFSHIVSQIMRHYIPGYNLWSLYINLHIVWFILSYTLHVREINFIEYPGYIDKISLIRKI